MEMIPYGSGLQPHSCFLRWTLALPGDGFGALRVTPTRYKRMIGRHLGKCFNGNFQDNKRQKGFEGTSLMLLWGLSTQPPHSRDLLLLWDSTRPEAGLSPLLQALLSPSSSSSLLKKSLLSHLSLGNHPVLSTFPLSFLPAELQTLLPRAPYLGQAVGGTGLLP